MADKEMIFCTIFVNRYLRIAKVYPRSRPSMKNGRPSSRHLRQQNEVQRSMKGVRRTPIRLSNVTTKNGFSATRPTTDISNSQESIRPDSELSHYRPLPSE